MTDKTVCRTFGSLSLVPAQWGLEGLQLTFVCAQHEQDMTFEWGPCGLLVAIEQICFSLAAFVLPLGCAVTFIARYVCICQNHLSSVNAVYAALVHVSCALNAIVHGLEEQSKPCA